MFPSEPEQSLDEAQQPLEIDEDELDELSGSGLPEFHRRGMQPDGGGHRSYA